MNPAGDARAWLLLAGAVVTEVAGSLSLRAAVDRPAFYVVVLLGYVAAFMCLTLVLRRGMPLSVAYGVWGASGVALTALAGAVLFDERITALMAFGMALVIGGVVLVESGSHDDAGAEAAGGEAADNARDGDVRDGDAGDDARAMPPSVAEESHAVARDAEAGS